MAFDAFLKLGDIKGESTDSKLAGQIEIQSFHWGVSNPTSGTGGTGAGHAVPKDLLLTAGSSKASPQLFGACAAGELIKEGLLTLRSAGEEQTTFGTIRLFNVTVAAYDQAAVPESGNPTDEFALRYNKIEFTYNTIKESFDYAANKKF